MKAMLTLAAMVVFLAFTATAASANPAMMKKHEGYPSDDGKSTTATGETAALKAAEDAPKALKGQSDAAGTSADREGNVMTDDPRQRKHPGYPDKGVTEGHIKDATKASPNP